MNSNLELDQCACAPFETQRRSEITPAEPLTRGSKFLRSQVRSGLTAISLVTLMLTARSQEPGRRVQVGPNSVTPSRSRTNSLAVAQSSIDSRSGPKVPPLPQGISDLSFDDFFKKPVGPFGLELTDRVKRLEGKRVRILGFMVREELEKDGDDGPENAPVRGRLMLTPLPATVNAAHYGLCDDLPPQILFVSVPSLRDQPLQHSRKPLLLTGVLSLGNTKNRMVEFQRFDWSSIPAKFRRSRKTHLSLISSDQANFRMTNPPGIPAAVFRSSHSNHPLTKARVTPRLRL